MLNTLVVRFLRAIPKLDDVSDAIAAIRADDAACGKISQVFDSLGRFSLTTCMVEDAHL